MEQLPNYIIAHNAHLRQFQEKIPDLSNYYVIETSPSKFTHILNTIESKYEDYFDDNLDMEIQYYMATNMLCWINPIRSATNTSENDAVWIAYPNVGDTINKCIEEEYLIIPTILNFDKHEGMLTWCGLDRSCFNNEYDSCGTCLYRELVT